MHRLEYIDAVRGIAAVLVLVQHLYLGPLALLESWMFHDVLDLGKLGVVWFFLISGVVIPFSFKEGRAGALRFVISRFFRLYPAYWLSIMAFVAALAMNSETIPSWLQVIANASMVQTALGVADVQPVYWTLFIEMIFYGLCLLLFCSGLLKSLNIRGMCSIFFLFLALLMAVARSFLDQKMPVAIPLSLSLMFFGSIWREVMLNSQNLGARRHASQLLIGFAVSIPAICITAYSKDRGFQETWTRYVCTYYLAISLFLLTTTRLKMASPILVWLGAISYSIYLLHLPVQMTIKGLSPFMGGLMGELTIAAIATIATIGAAYLSFKLVEQPSMRIGRSLDEWFEKRDVTSLANSSPHLMHVVPPAVGE